tara:strand:- start:4534 stop:5574 length:1041 start_codon:yes stop_codon:yes gene_type:complete
MKNIKDIKNATQKPKNYICRHMKQGVASGYTIGDKADQSIYVSNDAIKSMCKSFEGCPVYVGHQDVSLENIQAEADGYVSNSFYNEADGWFYAQFVAVSDKAHKAIKDGDFVSNAYLPSETAGEGTDISTRYDIEVLNGEFTHLAIVPNPRYEEAEIMTLEEFKAYNSVKLEQLEELKNSKDEKETIMFWNKKEAKGDEITNDTMVSLENEDVSVGEMISFMENAKKEEAKAKEEEKMNMESKVDVDGEEMSLAELRDAYLAKKNAVDEDKAENSSDEDEKENESDEDEKENAEKADEKESKEDKENSKDVDHKKDMENSIENGVDAIKVEITTQAQRIETGKSRY